MDGSLRALLYTVTRNAALDERRARSKAAACCARASFTLPCRSRDFAIQKWQAMAGSSETVEPRAVSFCGSTYCKASFAFSMEVSKRP